MGYDCSHDPSHAYVPTRAHYPLERLGWSAMMATRWTHLTSGSREEVTIPNYLGA